MAIPSLYAITLPFLELLGDGEMHGFRSAVSHLEQHFGMTDGEKNELVPSGKQTRLVNRIGWARECHQIAPVIPAKAGMWIHISSATLGLNRFRLE